MNNKIFQFVSHNWAAKVLSLAAAFLLFSLTALSQLEERYITVPLEIRTDEGMAIASSVPRTVRIALRGDAQIVSSLREEELEVYVDLSQTRQSGIARGPVLIRRNSETINQLEIRIEPSEVSLQLEPRYRKSVEVIPAISDSPVHGFEQRQYFVTPSMVEIDGPRSRVEAVESVKTETISLSGRREDFNSRIRLERPDPYISFPGGDTVDYRGIIEERVLLTTFMDVDINIVQLDSSLDLVSSVPAGSVRVQGSQLFLETLRDDAIQLEADASGIQEPGIFELSVRPRVPSELLTLRYEPLTLQLRFESPEGPATEQEQDTVNGDTE